jgi:Lsr2
VPAAEPAPSAVRKWAKAQGIELSDRGRIPKDVARRYREACSRG